MTHCDGCDQDQEGVRTFRIRYGVDWETVRYCPDCALDAGANWNGTTDEIVSVPA